MGLKDIFVIREAYDNVADAYEAEVTPEMARAEIARHGMSWEDFIQDVGEKPMYRGEEVLGWLGY